MTISNIKHENINDAEDDLGLDDLGLNIQRRHSFLAPDEMEPAEGCNSRVEDHGSASECPSAGFPTRPMSTIESVGSDESLSYQTDSTTASSMGSSPPSGMTYGYQVPQILVGNNFYQPLTYDQQQQFNQGYQIPCAQMGVPSYGYAPVQVQPMPMGLPLQNQLQPNQVLYPMQQCQVTPQGWVPMPLPTNAVPNMVGHGSYTQQCNPESYQAPPSVVSSAVSTPLLSTCSTPGYSTPYGYITTPVLSSASCTPMQYATCPEVPPLLTLTNNFQAGVIPQQISCSINMSPNSSRSSSASETPMSDCVTARNLKTEKKAVVEREEENLWTGTCSYTEYQRNGGSNLFITWSGSKAKLIEKLQSFKLEVRDVFTTSDKDVCNVIFESHPIARKAFTMQNQIRLRIVPPKNSHRIWLRNPSPKFLVRFETKCKLVVRKGKAECHDIVGELLKGCLICADQLKGNRIRVVSCEGSFMFPGGKVVEMKGIPSNSDEKATLGWISHRCKYTKEALVIRRSWNLLSDYVYKG